MDENPQALELESIDRAIEGRHKSDLIRMIKDLTPERKRFLLGGKYPEGVNVLVQAAEAGWVEGVVYLMGEGASVEGFGPLAAAGAAGQLEIVKMLTAAGADVNAKSALNDSVIDVVLKKRHASILAHLIKEGANYKSLPASGRYSTTVFEEALIEGWTPVVAACLDRGSDINAENKEGLSPLMIVISQEEVCYEMLDLLIGRGVDLEQRERASGMNPLEAAILTGREDLLGFLLSKGANVNAVNSRGETPLVCVLAYRKTSALPLMELCIKAGADLRHKNSNGHTVSDLARLSGQGAYQAFFESYLCKEELEQSVSSANGDVNKVKIRI